MSILRQTWKTLNLSLKNQILTVSMNRPKANAMSAELLNELIQAFDQASVEQDIRGVLLRSDLNSTFCAGADLSTMYELSSAAQKPAIDEYMFDKMSRGMTSPLYCSKPVACSLNGHTIAGGLMLALSCDYIAIGTRKPFRIGITGPIVGIPYPLKAVKLVRHQIEPQLAYRLLVDANLFSSADFPIRCQRGENPDELAEQWLQMIAQRPLKGFQITKQKYWCDLRQLDTLDHSQEKLEYFHAVTSQECLQAMKKALPKTKN